MDEKLQRQLVAGIRRFREEDAVGVREAAERVRSLDAALAAQRADAKVVLETLEEMVEQLELAEATGDSGPTDPAPILRQRIELDDPPLSRTRRGVLRTMETAADHLWNADDVFEEWAGGDPVPTRSAIMNQLIKMYSAGQIARPERGFYCLSERRNGEER